MNEKSNSNITRLVELSDDIAKRNPRETNSLVFMARPFVQTTLPHRDPGDVPVWFRKNGNLTLQIKPGYRSQEGLEDLQLIGVPYGSIPRLLLFWLTTESKKTGNQIIELGKSLSEFMRNIGIDSRHGGVRGDIGRVKDQMLRLFHSNISFTQTLKTGDREASSFINMSIIEEGYLEWYPENGGIPFKGTANDCIDNSWICLSDNFFKCLTGSSVPLDMKIIQEIKQSPLALDLYAWMTHRTYGGSPIEASILKPSFVSWRQLHDQFGASYSEVKDFKKKLKPLLRLVKSLSRNLFVEETHGGLNISRKLTPIK